MPINDYADVYDSAMAGYRSAIADEQAALVRAEASYDFSERVRAAQSIAAVRAQMTEFDRMAREHVASMQPPQRPARREVDLDPNEAARICGVDAAI